MKMLSPHFSLEELCRTDIAEFRRQNLIEAEKLLPALTALAFYLLEPVRTFLNTPLIITSGYRCARLNAFVKGSSSSQHLKGEAADFIPLGISCEEAFFRLKKCSFLHYGQLILEPSWIHISLGTPFRKLENCAQAFKK